MVNPASSFSSVTVAVVSRAWAVMPAAPSCPERAMVKHPAWAAAISSSGLVPGWDSKRVLNEYGVLLRTPLAEVSVPLPSFKPPLQWALAFRCMDSAPLIKNELKKPQGMIAASLGPSQRTGRMGHPAVSRLISVISENQRQKC